ncbi:MAG: magnesium transporter [Myxococcales bacterium FL481]|nr:MAG: magnesium transporter [Myxococcales bacterium FL481]
MSRPTLDLARRVRREAIDSLEAHLARFDDVQIAAELDSLDDDERELVLRSLPEERRPEVLEQMRSEAATSVIRRLAPEDAAALLDELDRDDVVDILGRLKQPALGEILSRFDTHDAAELQELLAYDPDSAGGRMAPETVRVPQDATVGDVVTQLQRRSEELPQTAFNVYVVDEFQRLVGVVVLRKLVVSPADQAVRHIMDPEVVSVSVTDDQEEVADLASRYDLVEIPVLDSQRRLVGVVTIDDIVDVLREEATEDILKMAGAGEMLVDTREFWSSFRVRLPWLGTAAIGGFLVAVALSGFADALRTVPALALFMPVIAGMGGNVGMQSSTIVVRGLAVGYVEAGKVSRLLLREALLGISFGLVYGVLIALSAPWLGDSVDGFRLGIVLVLGMVGSMTIAATVGASAPLLLHAANIDPAVATGPFVTTAVDILGLLFYFAMATWLLGVAM